MSNESIIPAFVLKINTLSSLDVGFVLLVGNNKYLYIEGKLLMYNGKVKTKANVVGYVINKNGNEIKITNFPIILPNEQIILKDLILVDVIRELNLSIFKGSKEYFAYFIQKDDAYFNFSYYINNLNKEFDIIYGIPVVKDDKNGIINVMHKKTEKILDIINEYPFDVVIKNAIYTLKSKNECNTIIALNKLFKTKEPEDLLVIAECFEQLGYLTDALRIYSLFDNSRYRELEIKIINNINKLIDEFDEKHDIKVLENAVQLLPTYDAPLLKLSYYYYSKREYEKAVKTLEYALSKKQSFHTMIMLAYMYYLTGEYSKALQVLENAEKIKVSGALSYIKGLIYENMNAKSSAEKEFIYACEEGVVDACLKVQPYKVHYYSETSFDPSWWKGYNLYGYKVIDVIGNGGSGYVLLTEKNGKKYASKVIKREYNVSTLINEIAKMQELSKGSRYLTKIYASFVDENYTDYFSSPPLIVMEYMEGGDLKNIIISEEYNTLKDSEKWPLLVALIYYRISQALYYLHSQNYIHADVKPSNILFSSKISKYIDEAIDEISNDKVLIKLSDLGSSVKKGDIVMHYTPYYAHPLQRFGSKAEEYMDVYSLSVSMYVTLTNNFPYPEWLEQEIEEAVVNVKKRETALKDFEHTEPRMDRVPELFKEVIYKGLKTEYLSVKQILFELEKIISEMATSSYLSINSETAISHEKISLI
ncbi:MAG: protein kinase [Sulfolobus sp.]|nr:protein kinase [Sulfolobus sp.]